MKKNKNNGQKALRTLKDSEIRYRRLFEAAQDGILILDAETGSIIDVNPFLLDMLGYSHPELQGKRLWEIGPFKDIPANQSSFQELQANKYIRYENLPLETKDNRCIQVEFVSNVYAVGTEKVIQCNIRDITARKRAEEELKHSEKNFRTILEAMPCAVLILNDQLVIKAANGAVKQTFGIPANSIINCHWCDALKCNHEKRTAENGSLFYSDCPIQNTVLTTLADEKTQRVKMNFEFFTNSQIQKRLFGINAAPIKYEGEKMVVLTVEDLTELFDLRQRLKIEHSFAGIVGQDEKMLDIYNTIRELAEASAPVLIQGESGTGKELVASALHNEGPRHYKKFVAVNCGALPDGLLESELFGHCRGAFTGAIRDKKGRFELADGGTIFLDEVGDLSPAMQVKLLRVLQNGSFEPVGSEKTMKVDVRLVCATNKDLQKEIKAGHFREDLYYRLCVVPITIPPLRERINDIPLLADNFLEGYAKKFQKEKASLSLEVLDILMEYDWPGNIRELQNALQFALIKCRDNVLKPEYLPVSLSKASNGPRRRPRQGKLSSRAVENALEKTRGNKVEAAKLLGVSRATLYRFLDKK